MNRNGSRAEGLAIGWSTGAVLAILEAIRAGWPSGGLQWGLLLATVGLYPLVGILIAVILGSVPAFRRPERLAFILITLMAFPWTISVIIPHISVAAVRNPLQWPRLAAVFIGTLMVARWAGTHHGRLRLICPPVTIAVVAGMGLLGAGSSLGALASRPGSIQLRADGSGPNVILISLDTVRRDALGCYGGPVPTPTLDSLAFSGIRFGNATSCAPWTLASVSSFMTGYYPTTTGVFTGENRLPQEFETLAEAFLAQGYHTHAIVTNTWLRPQFGLSQGFVAYDHRAPDEPSPRLYSYAVFRALRRVALRPLAYPPESASDVVDRALGFLRGEPPTPFFLWLHFNDAHDPYAPPRRYLPPPGGYRGAFRSNSGRIVRLRGGNRLSVEDRERIQELYHGEIRYLDDCLGDLLAGVRDAGLDHHTLVAVVSDHGEEFWEHGSVGHGHTLHAELLDVPFILSFPGHVSAGTVIDAPTTLADLAPTIRHLTNLPHVYDQGVALTDTMTPLGHSRPLIAEALVFFWETKSVLAGGWKLLLDPASGDCRLFDVAQDPRERFDVSRENPAVVSALRDTLTTALSRFRADADRMSLARDAAVMQLTPQLREQLRAQGYIE